MKTYFVSRHSGAKMWAESEGFVIDQVVSHFDTKYVQAGDKVLGTLPVHLAAEVCARGGSYYHLSLTVPQELRGVELSAEQMRDCGASLSEFVVLSPAQINKTHNEAIKIGREYGIDWEEKCVADSVCAEVTALFMKLLNQ